LRGGEFKLEKEEARTVSRTVMGEKTKKEGEGKKRRKKSYPQRF